MNKQYFNIMAAFGFILWSFISQAAHYIPSSTTGYLGYYPIQVIDVSIGFRNSSRYGAIGFSALTSQCSTFANFETQEKNVIEAVPGQQDVYGFKFYNSDDPSGGYILAAPNASIYSNIFPTSGGAIEGRYIAIVNSKVTSSMTKLTQHGPFCYQDRDMTITGVGSARISGLHFYAVGEIKPGQYKMIQPLYVVAHGVEGHANASNQIVFNVADTINVLKTCDIIPASPTNIVFSNQLTKTFSVATLLESISGSITFNCNQTGLSSIFLQPRNPLSATSGTGMQLTPVKSTSTVVPYIVTSLSTTARNNALCNDNAVGALKYFNKNDLNTVTMNTQNLLTYYFNLCAKGEIKPDIYTGSMDVQIMVQ